MMKPMRGALSRARGESRADFRAVFVLRKRIKFLGQFRPIAR